METANGPGTAVELYGDDQIAGGADDDMIFGQLGHDTIQGDGTLVVVVSDASSFGFADMAVDAFRLWATGQDGTPAGLAPVGVTGRDHRR